MTKVKVKDDEVFIAWQGASQGDYTVSRGDRLRGSHPMVRSLGRTVFVPDGTPQSEWPNPRDAIVEASDAQAKRVPPPKPNPSMDRPLRDFRKCVTEVSRLDGAWHLRPGDIVPLEHDAVTARPDCFAVLVPR